MTMRTPGLGLATGALAAILATAQTTSVRADDDAAMRCVQIDRIDQTRIVDEWSIVFFMRDRTVLQNVLPHACSGLRKTDRIKFDATLGRLCANEFVTQLVDVGRYAPGAVCQIGRFVPISDDEARRLLPLRKGKRDGPSDGRAIESKPVELPAPAAEPGAAPAPSPRSDPAEPARAATQSR